MKIDHLAVYLQDLERVKGFYKKYFLASSNQIYHNPKTGLKTYFLTFTGVARLELMSRPDSREQVRYIFVKALLILLSRLEVKSWLTVLQIL